jgi:hypothetical protein
MTQLINPELKLHTSYQAVDNRREKRYGKECHVQV